MSTPGEVRIDKWLWCVRLFKSRSMATTACIGGKVRINGEAVKPSRGTRIGETVVVGTGQITRTVKVLGLLERRVGAKLVPNYLEDLTPAAEYLKPREPAPRPPGTGRPTKKQRRQLEGFWGKS